MTWKLMKRLFETVKMRSKSSRFRLLASSTRRKTKMNVRILRLVMFFLPNRGCAMCRATWMLWMIGAYEAISGLIYVA